MKNIFKKIFSFGLAVAVCVGTSVMVGGASVEYVVADAATDYYAGITATGGNSLLGQVHDLITSTHKTYTTYVDCKTTSLVIQTDAGTEANMLMDFYSQENISAPWNGGTSAGTWNREHVWCQSLSGGLWGTSGGGSDMHHLRPSEVKLNATRGNNKFGEVNGGTPAYYIDSNGQNKYVGGYISGSTFEPLDKVKGDVARIVLYVYTHYNTYLNVGGTTNGSGSSSFFGTLNFTQIMTASNESAAIELLMQWHEADPVDEIETARNQAVYSIQGNRNPFVDHPEYVEAIWGDSDIGTETPGQTPAQSPTVTAFHNAVAGIAANSTPEAWLKSINTAIAAYRNLSEADVTVAADDIDALQAAIRKYNTEFALLYNSAASEAEISSLYSLGFVHVGDYTD